MGLRMCLYRIMFISDMLCPCRCDVLADLADDGTAASSAGRALGLVPCTRMELPAWAPQWDGWVRWQCRIGWPHDMLCRIG